MAGSDVSNRIAKAGITAIWAKYKKNAIAQVKNDEPTQAKNVAKMFDQGLNPKIKKYYTELEKFPDLDFPKIQKHILGIKKVVNNYQNDIASSVISDKTGMMLMLDGFLDLIDKDLKWYLKNAKS